MANLKDLIEDGIMKYDGYEGTIIGNLTVVGWNGKYQNPKKYIVTCSVCSLDTELHGEGYFAISKGHFVRGCIPCGCTDKCNWTEGQYKVRAERSAIQRNCIFIGWDGDFISANKTKCIVECPDHGVFKPFLSFLLITNEDKGCPGCFAVRTGNRVRKEDSVMIDKFMSTNNYPTGTVFTRSNRLDKYGHKKYWFVDCPECNTRAEGHVVGLYKGSRSCECSSQLPKETYINLIIDNNEVIAIKFGVANNSLMRIKDQKAKCAFDMIVYGVWVYPDTKSCKGAERTCMHTLPVGVLSKQEMPDGYTETTYPHNIDAVIKIFEECGGIRNI